jgi:hypothetical protein
MILLEGRKNTRYCVALFLFLLALAWPVYAQEDGIPVRFEGTIETMGTNTITVAGFAVDISRITPVIPLEVGMVVEVKGLLTANDRVIAAEITVLEAASPSETTPTFEYVGVVDSLEGTSLVVNGLTIDVSEAEMDEDIAKGDIVRLRALSGVVREVECIELDDDEDDEEEAEFKITDIVDRVGNNHVVIAGVIIFTVEAETTQGKLAENALVKVEGRIIDEVLIANQIEVFEREDRDREFEIKGTIQEVDKGSIVVSGVAVNISDMETDLDPETRVRVKGRIAHGEFVADQVEVFANPGSGGGN